MVRETCLAVGIQIIGRIVSEILSAGYETPPQGITKTSHDDFQRAEKLLTFFSRVAKRKTAPNPVPSKPGDKLTAEASASSSRNSASDASRNKKRSFTSDATQGSAPDAAQIKRLPVQNQWREPSTQ
ncbi:hypothetical protein OCU04_003504 [Sclerotinia nivalis]|uniref:Uncharacterized protein n=1 Tax=Sclerotinia nivalis TaxID=352851 RepID=A0A9X0AS52_9HELO|nr:hypothetical protein OCU04_003504 [Sclerotinia nivalis]